MRGSTLLIAVLLVPGCAPRADRVFSAPPQNLTGSSGAQPGYAVKLVREKQRKTEVIGDDGSVCRLTPERFARVRVGDWIACTWTIG